MAQTHTIRRRDTIAREKPPTELQKTKMRRNTISLDLAKKAALLAEIKKAQRIDPEADKVLRSLSKEVDENTRLYKLKAELTSDIKYNKTYKLHDLDN